MKNIGINDLFVASLILFSAGALWHLPSYAVVPSSVAEVLVEESRQVEQENELNRTVLRKAESIDLKEVVTELPAVDLHEELATETDTIRAAKVTEDDELETGERTAEGLSGEAFQATLPIRTEDPPISQGDSDDRDASKIILGVEVPPSTATRLSWVPAESFGDLSGQTPVLVVNGSKPGTTLCLVAAVHGDELNGIEMIRRIVYTLDPEKLTGTVIGVPIVNLAAFRRGSRYLPDRRDLNRYFPGNKSGSAASRIAHSFFTQVVRHCDMLVDLHTGSFHRTNLPQLRADLSDPKVAEMSENFGAIAVLNSRGHQNSLRAAAVRAGIPTVTMEAGEPLRLQDEIVAEGTRAIEALLHKTGMYNLLSFWSKPAPVYYRSVWVRADEGGFLFSRVALGARVQKGEVLGTVTDPITNNHSHIVSPHHGRVLGMALDQLVQPGFATYHIGIQTAEAKLLQEAPNADDGEEYLDTEADGYELPNESPQEGLDE